MFQRAADRLCVGLDVPDLAAARPLIAELRGIPGWLKVGSQLFTSEGPPAVAAAAEAARVFLDLKFHDIPNTVASAVASATRLGVGMMTVHTAGGGAMLRAARDAADAAAAAAGCERPRIIGVTVLTSLSAADLKEVGVAAGAVEDQVARLVDLALASGLDGVVASPREAQQVRARAGSALWIVTPGVRPADHPADDQARTARAGDAIASGSDILVVARPVVRAPDPAAAARALLGEIEAGLAARRA
jgi:orotidine-5'-phosphate decarboxylase